MTKTIWSDPADLGRALKQNFNRLKKRTGKKTVDSKDLVMMCNAMSNCAMQIVNLSKATNTDQRLEKVESLLAMLPKDTIDKLKEKMIIQYGQ